MDNIDIKNTFLAEFFSLKEFGYNTIGIYENEGGYKLGIVLENIKINQKFSFVYYENNPTNTDSKHEYGLLLKLFKGNEHIDFSRLLAKDSELSSYVKHQYFIIPKEYKIEDFIKKLSEIIFKSYKDILLGNNWIKTDYDLRDDY